MAELRFNLLQEAIAALQSPQRFAGDSWDAQDEAIGYINLFLKLAGQKPFTSYEDGSGMHIASE